MIACKQQTQHSKSEEKSDADSTANQAKAGAVVRKNKMPVHSQPQKFVPLFSKLDISSLPIVENDLGEFPYFKAPVGFNGDIPFAGNKNNEDDKFILYAGDGFYLVEGKVFIRWHEMLAEDGQTVQWNTEKFRKTFSDMFAGYGAKKIWEGTVPHEATEMLDKARGVNYYYKYGHQYYRDIILYGMNYRGKPVFFSIATNYVGGSIAVAEQAP